MRRLLLLTSVALLAVPTLAAAQADCHEQKQDSRAVGTVVGAGAGALIGGAIGKGPGAIAGAVGGGLIGNAAGGSSVDCRRSSDAGYYDANGVWHVADGYYDSDGRWVSNAPSGYYDRYGHWVAGAPDARAYGSDVSYAGARRDVDARENWIDRRIDALEDNDAITHGEADQDRRELNSIRQHEAQMRDNHDGLTESDRSDLMSRLDDLSADIRGQ